MNTENWVQMNLQDLKPNLQGRFKYDYFVSNLGRIRKGACILKQSCKVYNGNKYIHIRLSVENCPGIRQITIRVHRIVAYYFIGPKPSSLIVLHGIGGPHNNNVLNLSYGTYKQNSLDRVRDGTDIRGPDHKRAKFNRIAVWIIRYEHVFEGKCVNELAQIYSADCRTIQRIVQHKSYQNC